MNSGAIGYFRSLLTPAILTPSKPSASRAEKPGEREMLRSFAALTVALTAGLVAPAGFAGQCPPDKTMADATKPNPSPAKGVTDKVLAAINLADEPANIENRMLRLRKLTIAPGGVVPWHSHGDRPADHLHRHRRGDRIREQLRRSNRAQAATSRARPMSPPIGGRTREKKPPSFSRPTSCTTRAITTCDRQRRRS